MKNKISKKKRQQNYKKGKSAEYISAAYLMLQGYRILARRYKTPVGEIDLIAIRRNKLVFVEVKARSTTEQALWSVSLEQQQRIIKAAEFWLQKHSSYYDKDIQFDVIALAFWQFPKHIKQAFM